LLPLALSATRDDSLQHIMAHLSTAFGSAPDTLGRLEETAPCLRGSRFEASARLPSHQRLAKEFQIDPAVPPHFFADQLAVFEAITSTSAGIIFLTGGPGTGKVRQRHYLSAVSPTAVPAAHYFHYLPPLQTFLIRHIACDFAKRRRHVLLSASTGPAAKRLSLSAATVHSTFLIPVSGFSRPLPPYHAMRAVIGKASVFIVDEMSMITTDVFAHMLDRIMQVHDCRSLDELLSKVLVILVSSMTACHRLQGINT